MMNYISKNNYKIISVLMSFLMVLSVISFTKIEANASGTVDDFVERCYTVTLGRGSDPEGFADWKSQLTSGEAVGVHVAYGFLFSSEYTKKNKSNEDYVKDLYMLFMGREPDEAGFNDWVGQLEAGKSRTEVFAGFANSQEFFNICESYGITAGRYVIGYDRFQINNVNLFVERLYKVCFGRIGDIGGQKNWVEKLLNKQITGSECARSFIQSQEYENLGLSDDDYVENLYIALMGRASDVEGKENWLNALASGKTRDEVFEGFVNSIEFAQICNTYKIDRGSYKAKDIGIISKPEYKVGDIIKFGKYEQDGNLDNGKEDIEWQILSVEDGRILVISKYALDCVPYNTEWEEVTWETCSLRKWMNNDFYNEAFSNKEKNSIPSVTLENKDNSKFGTDGGNDTIDKVFCLSFEDTETYFGEYITFVQNGRDWLGVNENLLCEPTQYTLDRGAYYFENTEEYYERVKDYLKISPNVIGCKEIQWWLRTPGTQNREACCVLGYCNTEWGMVCVNVEDRVVRPAMYIEY